MDVVIIGAGVAGLAAAAELSDAGLELMILEARDRIGGRLYSVSHGSGILPVELGAEFIDVPGSAWDALRAAGGSAYRSVNGMWEVTSGTARPLDLMGMLEETLDRLRREEEKEDRTFLEWLRAQPYLSTDLRTWAARYVEGFHAAELDRVGVHWLAQTTEGAAGGGGEVRHLPLGGFARVAEGLRSRLGPRCTLRTRAVATRIRWSPRGVEVDWREGSHDRDLTIGARHVIVTVPLGVLQALSDQTGAITFDPPLPRRREEAVHSLAMGRVLKIVLSFERPLWEEALTFAESEESAGGEHAFLMSDGLFPTWWTPAPLCEPRLTAWAGGGAVARVQAKGNDPVEVALDTLATMLAVPRDQIDSALVRSHFHDWEQDPFARGAYSYVPAGSLDAQAEIAKPAGEVIFFAGEATATEGWNGTVDGAIDSGRRAAREILESPR